MKKIKKILKNLLTSIKQSVIIVPELERVKQKTKKGRETKMFIYEIYEKGTLIMRSANAKAVTEIFLLMLKNGHPVTKTSFYQIAE